MRRIAPRLRRTWPAVLLAALMVAVFWRTLLLGEGLSAAGLLLTWKPWATVMADRPPLDANVLLVDLYGRLEANEEFISRWVLRGVWPLWNPELAHGLPTIGSIQNAEYYPTNLLLWPLPPFWTRAVRAMLRIAVCLLGTYGFGRSIGMTRPGATLAAMCFGFGGFTTVWLGYPVSNVSVLLPAILWTLEGTLRFGTFGWGAGLVLATGAALLGGHPPTVLHVATLVGTWLAYRLLVPAAPAPRLPLGRTVLRVGACALGGAILGAAAILPWLEYVAQNLGDMVGLRARRVLSWRALVAWVVPDFYGDPAGPEHRLWDTTVYGLAGWENYVERTGYVGVAALFLAALGLLAHRPRHAVLPWALGLVVAAIFVYDPPVLGALARGLPGFAIVNNSKMVCVAAFALAMLAGLGCDGLVRGTVGVATGLAAWVAVALATGGLVATLWPDTAQWAGIIARDPDAALLRDCAWALVPAASVAAALLVAHRGRRVAAGALLLTVSALDLWRFATPFNPTLPAAWNAPATPGIAYLQAHATGGRVLPIGTYLLPGNTLTRYGIADVRGGDWINVRHYELLIAGRTGHYDFGMRLARAPDTWRALNLARIVTAAGAALDPRLVPDYDAELRIAPIPGALPRALLVHEAEVLPDHAARARIAAGAVDLHRTVLLAAEAPGAATAAAAGPRGDAATAADSAGIVSAAPNEVVVAVSAGTPGYLLLNDTYFPGWRCDVDGTPTTITRANVAFRAVPVPAGEHVVRFRYRPWPALVGAALSAAMLVGLAATGLARRRRRSRARLLG